MDFIMVVGLFLACTCVVAPLAALGLIALLERVRDGPAGAPADGGDKRGADSLRD